MKINKFFAAAIAATTLFASCSKEETGIVNNGDERRVQVSIDRSAPNGTRATGSQVANGTDVTFGGGYLLFTNAGDVVTLVVEVSDGDDAYDKDAQTVGIDQLDKKINAAGVEIQAVPGASTKVYLVGNAPSGMTAPAVNDALSSYTATVLSQLSTNGGVGDVSLFGGGALVKTSAEEAEVDQYESEFTVKPIAARFEIAAITGTPSENAETFTYQIDGIFIDRYYNQMQLSGGALAGDLKFNYNTVGRYVPDAAGSSYTTAMNKSVYDYNATAPGLANNTSFSPATGVWNYNLLAPTSAKDGDAVATVQMPAIIISISNVVVDGEEWPGQYFLTIEKFYDLVADTEPGHEGEFINGALITQLAQGNVYVIDNIDFDETDLGDPYIKTKRVAVKVNMMQWESKKIGWEF